MVVVPLSPLVTGDTFAVAEWPLHVTVVAPFHTEHTPGEVAAVIAEVAAAQTVITARADVEARFGRRHDIPVTLVVPDPGLTLLHDRLVDALRPLAARPHEPAFTGPEFRAHVTIKGGRRVTDGDELTLAQLALVDMAPRADAAGRAVLATVALRPFP
ncbi:2'-5' RNA ligase family protein [Cryobacterium frigoriphilum]|uniref:2'-5' RNA ligase family protein n=1 Tax=Cryobacterium frigoriphilum TaxID=1259150 RepID=UPI00141A83AB|nr:2'-5' RNA ligase family protein [Cryobacterium frigoriphilum]